MPPRHSWRAGQYIMQDDDTGAVYWDDALRMQWDGKVVHRRRYDSKHPHYQPRPPVSPEPGLGPVRKPRPLGGGAFSSAFDGAFDGPPAGGNVGIS